MSLIECAACGHKIGKKAKICPSCGTANKKANHLSGKTTLITLTVFFGFLLSMCVNYQAPQVATQAPTNHTKQKEALKKMVATGINLNGFLCAEVTSITPLKLKDTYQVSCITYRGGTATKDYIYNSLRNKASEM